MTGLRKKLESWLEGAVSIIDLGGASHRSSSAGYTKENIWNAIGSDFQAVGRDMDCGLLSGFSLLSPEDQKKIVTMAAREQGNGQVSARDIYSHDRTVDSPPIDSMSRANEQRDNAQNPRGPDSWT